MPDLQTYFQLDARFYLATLQSDVQLSTPLRSHVAGVNGRAWTVRMELAWSDLPSLYDITCHIFLRQKTPGTPAASPARTPDASRLVVNPVARIDLNSIAAHPWMR